MIKVIRCILIFDKSVPRKWLVVERNTEIWASGVSIQYTQGTFDTLVVKVILGSFGVHVYF